MMNDELRNILESSPAKMQALFSCQYAGITTLDLAIQEVRSEQLRDRSIRSGLAWLAAPPLNTFQPALKVAQPRLLGCTGRPENVYLLTEFGAEVLNELLNGLRIKAPSPRDKLDLTHRYLCLKVFERARSGEMEAKIEYSLENHAQKVRADVFLEQAGLHIAVEVEQKLPRKNLNRAVRKFVNWKRYIEESGQSGQWRIYLLFNVRKRERRTVIRSWQEALHKAEQEVGNLPFSVLYFTSSDLLGKSSLSQTLIEAEFLDKLDEELDKPDVEITEEKPEVLPNYISPKLYTDFEMAMDRVRNAKPDQGFFPLIELASLIHQASFSAGSPTITRAVFPWASIWLMRRYLDDPWMEPVKTKLREEFKKMRKRNLGVIMLRETMTGLIWDTLLFHHGLGRGGALRAVFQVPDFQDLTSDFRVEVLISNGVQGIRRAEQTRALSWFLSSLYLYREKLGLTTPKGEQR